MENGALDEPYANQPGYRGELQWKPGELAEAAGQARSVTAGRCACLGRPGLAPGDADRVLSANARTLLGLTASR